MPTGPVSGQASRLAAAEQPGVAVKVALEHGAVAGLAVGADGSAEAPRSFEIAYSGDPGDILLAAVVGFGFELNEQLGEHTDTVLSMRQGGFARIDLIGKLHELVGQLRELI